MRPGLVIATVAFLAACSAERDFDKACEIATTVIADKSVPRPERGALWARRTDEASRSQAFREAMHALGSVAPEDKYALFEQAARERGRRGWSCPAVRKMFLSPEEDLSRLCNRASALSKHGGAGATGDDLLKQFKPWSDEVLAIWPKVLAAPAEARMAMLKGLAEPGGEPFECEALASLFAAPKRDPGAQRPR